MKELSIEEKAKAYDEAKARMSRAFNSNRCTIGFMNEIFPELKESEDERIRKSLIAIITDFENLYLQENYSLSKKEALVWLEKLGQIKSPISQHENKMCLISKDERIRAQLIEFFSGYNTDEEWWGNITEKDILAWLEKQGTDISSFPKEQQEFMQKYASLDKITLIKLLAERDANNAEIIESFEKHGEQKPAEWSEEDEDILNTIINHFKIDIECTDEDDTVRWLKSLKDRYTWRPSEMQMTALRRMKNAVGGEGEIYEPLNSLYEDLKKLKD